MMNTKRKEIRDFEFGEIYLCDFSKSLNDSSEIIKPALVLGRTENREAGSVIKTLPLRDIRKRNSYRGSFYLPKRYGLRKDSIVNLNEPRYFRDVGAFLKRIGKIKDEDALCNLKARVENYTPEPELGIVLTLCPKCLQDFMRNEKRIIRRLDPFESSKQSCSYCSIGLGYNYMIVEKK